MRTAVLLVAGVHCHRDAAYSRDDLDQIVRNFHAIPKSVLSPCVATSYEEDGPAVATVLNLRRNGDELVADLGCDVGKSKVGCEIYEDFADDAGRGWGFALRRVILRPPENGE